MKKFAIIGFGCAGYNGAKAIRAHDSEAAIHVFDHSGAPPFNPMLSTYHASGKLPYDAVFPFGTPEEISQELQLQIMGETVTEVTAQRAVITDKGVHEGYDAVLLATGANALVPGFLTCTGKKWFLMRTLNDALALRQHLDENKVRTAAVVGASMVGIKVAELLQAIIPIPVHLWDERSTTVTAAGILGENNVYGKKRKQVLDAVAAQVILESFLAWRKNHPGENPPQ